MKHLYDIETGGLVNHLVPLRKLYLTTGEKESTLCFYNSNIKLLLL